MVAESFKRSHKLLALCVALAFASAALALGFAVTADAEESGSSSQPTISSDKADYPPGGTVILTGSGWQPGESVNIFVNDDEGKTWSRDVDVTADENGNIRDEFQLPDWFVAQYSVKATGTQSGVATTSFTDAPVKVEGKDNVANAPYDGGPLEGWKELDKVPMRLVYTNSGSQTLTVEFDHSSTSGRRIPGIRALVDWSGDSRISSLNAQLTDTTGPIWTYTVTANAISGTNNSNPGYVFFNAHLAAGSHAYPGASMQIKLGGAGNGTIGIKPSDVLAARPDLVVDKTGPTTASPGSTIEYKIYKDISTTGAATGAALTDVLPSDANGNPLVTFDSCSDNCTVTGNEVSWIVGDLAPGAGTDPNNQLSRTLKVKIPQNAANGTSYVNNSDILSADNEQDLAPCTAADSDNNAENDTPDCDNYDSLKTTVASNSSPNSVNDSYNVNEDQTLNVADGPNDVLANDTDPDNDPLTVTGNTQPQHGSVTVNANGSFTYTPDANYNGPDSFNYTVSDGKGGTATGTVNITVNPVNDTPTITPNIGDKTILEDTDTGNISFTVGDADSAAGDLIVAASSSDTTLVPNDNANLILGGGGANRTIKVKSAADRFGGPATITLTVSDGTGSGSQSATETFDVNVTPVNDAPSFDVPASAPSVDEDAAAQTVANFATNISVGPFESSQSIAEFQVTNNSNPSLFSAGPAIDPDSGDLTYTPAPDASGTANITVRAKDDGGTANGGVDTSTEKTFSITLDPVNDAPVNSVPGTQDINEDEARVFSAANGNQISVSDIDAGSDDVKVTLTADNGKITLGGLAGLVFSSGDGTDDAATTFTSPVPAINTALSGLTFTPNANYDGSDAKLTIETNDQGNNGSGGEKTDTDSVAFDIAADNDPPVIDSVVVANTNPVQEGSPATIEVTATDPDTPSSDLRYSFDCDNDGTLEKSPQAANTAECTYFDNGTYPVEVKVTDDADNSDTDSVNVTVVNVAPTATFDAAPNAIDEGQNVELSLTSVVDPGTEDTHEYRFDCGDGFGAWVNSANRSCATSDDGQITLKGQVRDDDGGGARSTRRP